MKLKKVFLGLLLTALIVFGAGCAGMQEGAIGAEEARQYNLVVNESVPLKEFGPNQTVPASKTLEPGTRVRVISGGDIFVYVETLHGDRGFIPRSTLQIQKEEE